MMTNQKKELVKTEYVKCRIPEIPKPQYEKFLPDDNPSKVLEKLMYNYELCKSETKLLRQAIELCNE